MNLLDNGAGDASQPTGGIPSRHRRAKALGAASVALGLAVSVAGVAGAATSTGSTTAQTPRSAYFGHHGAHPGAGGTVASVGTSSFTLTDRHSTTVIVDLSSTTTFEEPGNTSPSSADVKVGDRVFAVGTEASGTVTATKVFIGGAGGTGGRFAWGSGDHGASQWRSSTAPSAQGAAA